MKHLFDPLFTAYCLIWAVIHAGRYFGHPIPLLNGHLTDLLTVPAIAHLTVTVIRRFSYQKAAYRYPFSYLIFIALYAAVVFEWLMPRYSAKYTADGWDVVAYLAGAVFYYYCHGSRASAKKTASP